MDLKGTEIKASWFNEAAEKCARHELPFVCYAEPQTVASLFYDLVQNVLSFRDFRLLIAIHEHQTLNFTYTFLPKSDPILTSVVSDA